jgi:hypothetical protein
MRYYFNIKDGGHVIRDTEGSELADPVAAAFEARMIARDILIERLRAGRELDGQEIEIADERGTIVETMKIRDVVSAS